jgi:anaerobic selenocysteine-containing dehydrogenase
MSRAVLPPASDQLLSETAIVCGLARATLGVRSTVDWEALAADYDRIRDLIAQVIPDCENFNEKVRRPGGFHLPNGPREGTFKTATDKAMFTIHSVPETTLAHDQFLMTTIRSHDQFNTTIYGHDDRYRGIYGNRRVVLLNALDIQEFGLAERQEVDLISCYHGVARIGRRFKVVPYAIPRRCAATYFPESNVVVPIDVVADISNTPISKSVVITIRASATADDA